MDELRIMVHRCGASVGGSGEKVASAIAAACELGPHATAPGAAFSVPALGAEFADGVFVGRQGSCSKDKSVAPLTVCNRGTSRWS